MDISSAPMVGEYKGQKRARRVKRKMAISAMAVVSEALHKLHSAKQNLAKLQG